MDFSPLSSLEGGGYISEHAQEPLNIIVACTTCHHALAWWFLTSSGNEINFDGNRHHIAYTFKRKSEQVLYFDGNVVAKGFYDDKIALPLTGLAVYDDRKVMYSSYETEDVYDTALSEEEIKEIIDR